MTTPIVKDLFKQLTDEIDQSMEADRRELLQLLQAMQRNAKADKPYDRLQVKFTRLLQRSQQQFAGRQRPVVPKYDDALPICQKRQQILALIRDNQVLILAGETGSGKTTQLPKFCLELGRGSSGLIGHTQPRRLAARAVADRIAEELGEYGSQLVGYQVRFDTTVSDTTRVKLMTDGILLAEAQHDRLLAKYDTLIIDEAHERSLNIDFLLGYLKRLLPKRPDLKVIITSATIDVQRFSEHFNNAPVLEVSGRTFPVEVLYRPAEMQQLHPLSSSSDSDTDSLDLSQRILAAMQEIEQLERGGKGHKRGDVLVFVSGEREIREGAEQLRKAVAAKQLAETQILPLYARLSQGEQHKIFRPSGRGRRIILATNVAETSLTVPGIRYVIDSGVARVSRYSVRSKVQRLPIEPISQASANQRKGRCGRVSDGICIRLFDEDDFNSRPSFTDAEILRTNLAAVILQMESLQLGAIEQFPFIDPPDSRQIRDGVKLLEELGAIRHDKINATGKQLSRLPVDPRIGRMVLEAAKRRCLSEVLVIASVLGIQDPRERPADKKQQSDEAHKTHQDKESDFVSLLNLWNSYEVQRQELSQGQLRRYCQKHFLSFMRMREWRDLHRQLLLACKALKLELNSTPADYETLHRALLAGLLSHVGFKQEDREYLGARNRKFRVFPGSNLSKGKVKWLMAAELTETSQLFARLVARIEPGWIEPLAEHLIKRSHSEPHWEKKAAQVTAFEKVTLYGLVIVPRRKVNFGVVDPEIAQQIFIRSALVEGDFTTKAPFFDHNRQLLEEVAALEDRSRRRDILIDEEQLFAFYREQLIKHGGDRVVNGASFEKWRKKVEQSDAQALFLTREALMRHGATSVNQQQYPDALEHGGLQFRLHYNFSPGAVDDGVSVDVPIGALNRLPVGRLQWLVPGMLRDKCIALVRGLPKSLRKQCVPVPDRVDAFLIDAVADDSNLTEALAYSLKRQLGVMIDNGDWDEAALDDHYRFNIRLLNADGQLLSQSRDWAALAAESAAKFVDSAEIETPTEQLQSEWQRSGIERWDFGELPLQVELDQAGMKVPAFPALCAEDAVVVNQPTAVTHKRSKKNKSKKGGGSVPAAKVGRSDTATLSVRLFPTLALAQQAHRLGVIRLLQMKLIQPLNELCRKLPQLERSSLLFGKLGTKQQLLQDFQQGLLAQLYIGVDALPRNSADFDALLQRHKAELWPTAERLADNLQDLLMEYQAIGKKLSGNIQLSWAPVLNDIKTQLQHLLYIGFIRETPKESWLRISVYLKAVTLRLDKFQQDLNKQRLYSEQLQQLWQEFEVLYKQTTQAGADSGELTRYRWMLEEYRVSLFAQQLGTQMTVSEKRLKQQLAGCRL